MNISSKKKKKKKEHQFIEIIHKIKFKNLLVVYKLSWSKLCVPVH